jgi:hypothetical protein
MIVKTNVRKIALTCCNKTTRVVYTICTKRPIGRQESQTTARGLDQVDLLRRVNVFFFCAVSVVSTHKRRYSVRFMWSVNE